MTAATPLTSRARTFFIALSRCIVGRRRCRGSPSSAPPGRRRSSRRTRRQRRPPATPTTRRGGEPPRASARAATQRRDPRSEHDQHDAEPDSAGTTPRTPPRQQQQQHAPSDAAEQGRAPRRSEPAPLAGELAAVADDAGQRPGTSPMVLDTLAVTGGTPNASRVGNVINVPDPTTVLMVPAATPARAISTASSGLTPRGLPARRSGRAARAAPTTGRARGLAALRRGDALPRPPCWSPAAPPRPAAAAAAARSGPCRPACAAWRPCGMPAISWIEEPRPSIALVISDGMTHTLLALPSAIFGIIWRYW